MAKSTEPAPVQAAEPVVTETESTEVTDWQAEAEKWKAMSRKTEKQAKDNSEAATRLKELEDLQKTTEQKLTEELETYRSDAASAKAALLKYEVATAKNVPASALALLNGATREDLEASADAILALVGETAQAQPVAPNLRQGNQGTPAAQADPTAALRAWLHS